MSDEKKGCKHKYNAFFHDNQTYHCEKCDTWIPALETYPELREKLRKKKNWKIGVDISIDKTCRICGTKEQVYHEVCGENGIEHECCECHVKGGHPPADWHYLCMKTKRELKTANLDKET